MQTSASHLVTSVSEEIANAVTHGIGALVSIGAGAVLITLAALTRDPWLIVGSSVFVASLVLLYTASTLYHAIPNPTARRWLQVVDHCAIYVLIAGTYTPFTLGALRGTWGWSLFGVIWGLAVTGVVFKLFFTGRFKIASTLIYIGMGWLIVVAAQPLLAAVDGATFGWLLAGGIAYTAGTIFYASRRIPFAHAIWHVFVLAGSGCHFAAVLSQTIGSS